MIGIKLVGGDFLYIPPTTSIRMEFFSSVFYDEQGSYSYPFTIPIRENAYKLGFPEDLRNANAVGKKFEVEIWRKNNFWKRGIMRIRTISGKNYSVNLNTDSSLLADRIADVKLRDLEFDGEREIRPGLYLKMVLTGSGTTGTVSIRIGIDSTGSLEKSVSFNTSINQTLQYLAQEFNNDTAGRASVGLSDFTVDGDILKVYSTVENEAPRHVSIPGDAGPGRGWDTTDPFNTGDIIDHMNLAAAGTSDNYDWTFFPVKNPDFYSNNDDYIGYVNYYENDTFVSGTFEYPITPFPYMLYVLRKCFNENGLNLLGGFLSDADIKQLVIYNNYALDNILINAVTGDPYTNNWTDKINLQNHVPDISVGDFIKAVKTFFFLAYFYNNEKGEVTIKTLNEILTSPDHEDWTDIASPVTSEEANESDGFILSPKQDSADDVIKERVISLKGYNIKDPVETIDDLPTDSNEINDIRLVLTLNVYYKVLQNLDEITGVYEWIWEELSENLGDFTIGNGKEKIDLLLSTTSEKRIEDAVAPDKNWNVPYVKQPGSSKEYDQGINPFSLRLLYYRGLQVGQEVDESEFNYPLGTPYALDYAYQVIGSETLALDFDSDQIQGVYLKRAKKWLDFKSNLRPVEIDLPGLDENKIRNLDFSLKKRINGVVYLLAKLDLTDTMTGKMQATGLFYKL